MHKAERPATSEQEYPELAELYRPLDREDRPWMEQLGYVWPDESDEEAQLEGMNNLLIVGGEQLSSHPDTSAEVVRAARVAYLRLFPTAETAYMAEAPRLAHRYLATNHLTGTLRLLWACGLNVGQLLTHTPTLLTLRPDNAISRLKNLEEHGIDPLAAIRNDPYISLLTQGVAAINEKLRVAYSLGRAWGWNAETLEPDVSRLLEQCPHTLACSPHKLRTLGRICTELFALRSVETISPKDIQMMTIPMLETIVTAYLRHGQHATLPRSLAAKSRLYRAYTREELREYIIQYPDNRVVRSYLRRYPLTPEEKTSTPQDRPSLRASAAWASSEPYTLAEALAQTASPTHAVYVSKLKRMPPLDKTTSEALLDLVAQGLYVEELPIRPLLRDESQERAVAEGRRARQQLAASFAIRILDRPRKVISEDHLQTDFLKLMIGILNLSRRHPKDRPQELWPFLEDQIIKIKNPWETDEETGETQSS